MFCTALLGTLTGCVGYVDRPRGGSVYAEPPPVYVQREVVLQDDYLYYPCYQIYYSRNRRQYIYRHSRSWVTRPMPPRVSVDVLLASPAVSLDFHDHPSAHHARVVRQYPKHWVAPDQHRDHNQGPREFDRY